MTAFHNDHSTVDFGAHGDRKASEGKARDCPLVIFPYSNKTVALRAK